MPSLTIRNIPEPVLRRMRQAAKVERRSQNSQAVHWLENGATQWEGARDLHRAIAAIRERREAMFRRHGKGIDSVELVRRTRRRGHA